MFLQLEHRTRYGTFGKEILCVSCFRRYQANAAEDALRPATLDECYHLIEDIDGNGVKFRNFEFVTVASTDAPAFPLATTTTDEPDQNCNACKSEEYSRDYRIAKRRKQAKRAIAQKQLSLLSFL